MPDRTIVGTRCRVPTVPEPVVRRPRLEALLADGNRCPVTLVAGPPGVGKTTLLTCCFPPVRDGRTTWLTVDAHDDHPRRVVELVVEALRRSGAVSDPLDPVLSAEAQLDGAFEQLLDRAADWVLVLDDVHKLSSPSTLKVLTYLVEQTPAALHVVVSTRTEPPTGWERLGLDGRLRQVRWADLAFDKTEAAQLLAAHGLSLGDDDIETLWRRTEGWVAGLRLAVGAFRSDNPHRLVEAAAATEQAAAEYLLAEVLAKQETDVQDFLLHTSVAELITPDLAVALTGDPDAGSRLVEVYHRGLFLTALDGTSLYRYHSLFRSLLQAHLSQRGPGATEDLHRKAAGWYLRKGLIREAEAHARATGDWCLVGRLLLARWLDQMVDDSEPWPDDALVGIPAEAMLATPELAMVAATEACRWGRQDEAVLYREALTTRFQADRDERNEQARSKARLLCDVAYGWSFGADDRSRAAVRTLRKLPTTDASTVRLRKLAVIAEAAQDIDAGDLDRAHHSLDELVEPTGPAWHCALGSAILAVIDACSGALRAADERVATVRANLAGRPAAPTAQLAALAAALCAAQRGDRHPAEGALPTDAEPLQWSSPALRSVDRVMRAAANSAPPFFVSLDETTARHPLAERALLALGVLDVLDHRGRLILLGGKSERGVLDARRHLAEGAPERADAPLAERLDHPTERHPRTTVEATVLAAIAADARGDASLAAARLRTVFDLVRATGIIAPLLAHGTHLHKPIEKHVDGLGASTVTALELLDHLQPSGTRELVEPLTGREIEVLRRLPTLMSNAEIAEALYLSVNTVKTHLKAIYRKLGVHNRRGAVRRGRELELV